MSLRPSAVETLRNKRVRFMIQGGVMMALGAVALAMPKLAATAVVTGLGILLLASGVFGLVSTLWSGGADTRGTWWHLISAALAIVAGATLLWFPVAGAVTIAMVLAAYFVAGGLTKIATAMTYRRDVPQAWLWMLASALIDLVLAALIATGWLGSAVSMLGWFVGINLIAEGLALLMAAIYAGRAYDGTAARL